MEVDVLIPVYRPDGKLTELLKRLKMQNYPIHRVILMNTEEKHFPAELTGIWDRVEVYHLAKEEFDHGGTRDRGVPHVDSRSGGLLDAGCHAGG